MPRIGDLCALLRASFKIVRAVIDTYINSVDFREGRTRRMQARHDGHWCKTTLYYRGWSGEEIIDWLGEPDLLDYWAGEAHPPGQYYRIERVLQAESRRDQQRRQEQRRRTDALLDEILHGCREVALNTI